MTEPKPTYTTTPPATVAAPTPVTCSNCGAVIGEYVTEGRQVWLKIGTVKIRHAHGICECKNDWYWTSSDKLLERIVEHRRRNTDRRETE